MRQNPRIPDIFSGIRGSGVRGYGVQGTGGVTHIPDKGIGVYRTSDVRGPTLCSVQKVKIQDQNLQVCSVQKKELQVKTETYKSVQYKIESAFCFAFEHF